MQKQKMKLFLILEYETPELDYGIDDEITRAHKDVFESSPIDFLKYIISNKESTMEYEFSPSVECDTEGENEEFFNCGMYYYDPGQGSICLKYGALCSNILCRQMSRK